MQHHAPRAAVVVVHGVVAAQRHFTQAQPVVKVHLNAIGVGRIGEHTLRVKVKFNV